jgi:hypothetical protein
MRMTKRYKRQLKQDLIPAYSRLIKCLMEADKNNCDGSVKHLINETCDSMNKLLVNIEKI